MKQAGRSPNKSRALPKTLAAPPPPPSRPRSKAEKLEHARKILAALKIAIPEPRCELDFKTPFELLVATILSAQTTDKGVNKVTPVLFARFPTPRALADAPQEEVEAIVKPTGFFRVKAKSIRAAAKIVADEFGGEVPRTMDEMLRIPGVARKTANVVLGTAYGLPSGIAVDTHVTRVAGRLGLTRATDPVAIERDLMALFPESEWPSLAHRFILHGRYTSLARSPNCTQCPVRALCFAPEARAADRYLAEVEARAAEGSS